jgi:hypothetical protein
VGAWTGSEPELTESIEAFAELRAELDDPFGDPPATLGRRNLDRAACERIEHTWKTRLGETGAESLAGRFAEAYRKRVQGLRTERHTRAAPQGGTGGAHQQLGIATPGRTGERRGAAPWPHADLGPQLAAAAIDETATFVPVLLPALPFGPATSGAAPNKPAPASSAAPRPGDPPAVNHDPTMPVGGQVDQSAPMADAAVDQTAELDPSMLALLRSRKALPFDKAVGEGAAADAPAQSQPNGSSPESSQDPGERTSRDGDD